MSTLFIIILICFPLKSYCFRICVDRKFVLNGQRRKSTKYPIKYSYLIMLSKFRTNRRRRFCFVPSSSPHSILKNQISVWAWFNVNISEMTNVFNHLYIYIYVFMHEAEQERGEKKLGQQSLLYNYFGFFSSFGFFSFDDDTNDNREQWCSINICSQAFSLANVPHVPSIAHRQSRSASWLRDWN